VRQVEPGIIVNDDNTWLVKRGDRIQMLSTILSFVICDFNEQLARLPFDCQKSIVWLRYLSTRLTEGYILSNLRR